MSPLTAWQTAKVRLADVWKPVALVAYCIVLATVSFRHEPWFDEAQAWLLARDASLWDLAVHYLRYEGSPGLWHLLLMAPAKLGLPYWSMQLVAGLAGTTAAAIVLWLSPFPLPIRIAIPFSYFLIYQYAVVARSYALMAPLLFAIAWILPRAKEKPWPFFGLLILLANVSVHGTLAAIAICGVYLLEILRRPNPARSRFPRSFLWPAGLFLLALAVIALQLWPPSDGDLATGNTRVARPFRALDRAGTQVAEAFSFRLRVAFIPLALSLFWLFRRRAALYFLVPAGLVLAFSSLIYSSAWHGGILFLLWLFAMWVATDRDPRSPLPSYVWLAWVIVLGIHLYWSVRAGYRDFNTPYSGSKAVAEYITPAVASGRTFAAKGFMAIEVHPYFQSNLYLNYHQARPPAFWVRPPRTEINEPISVLTALNPDVIVISLWKTHPPDDQLLTQALLAAGYPVIRRFPGELVWKSGVLIDDSFMVASKTPMR